MNAVAAFAWTPENVERLRVLAAEGLRAAQIAHRMGITELAVIGRCARLQIELGAKPPAKLKGRSRRDNSPIVEEGDPMFGVARPAREDAWRPIGDAIPVDLLERSDDACPWPIESTPHRQLCCGRTKPQKLPYCPEHTALAYEGGNPNRPAPVVKQFIRSASYHR